MAQLEDLKKKWQPPREISDCPVPRQVSFRKSTKIFLSFVSLWSALCFAGGCYQLFIILKANENIESLHLETTLPHRAVLPFVLFTLFPLFIVFLSVWTILKERTLLKIGVPSPALVTKRDRRSRGGAFISFQYLNGEVEGIQGRAWARKANLPKDGDIVTILHLPEDVSKHIFYPTSLMKISGREH